MDRRGFVKAALATPAALALAGIATSAIGSSIRAVAFDGFVLFDPQPVADLAETMFPGKGNELMAAWRSRQFEYSWLRNSLGRYVDFSQVTSEALIFAAEMVKLDLSRNRHDELMTALQSMRTYPDVVPALDRLRTAGIRLAVLSNLTEASIRSNLASAGLEGRFEMLLSTDRVGAFKPDPRAYQIGVDALHLSKEQILFAAFGGWDAAGAKSFGYPTYWANRARLPMEQLGLAPDAFGTDIEGLPALALTR